MRKVWLVSGVVLALLGGTVCADAACYRRWLGPGRHGVVCNAVRPHVIRFEPGIPEEARSEPLRMASAVLSDPPLIWSPTTGALRPPPYGAYRIRGSTIPIEEVIGRTILPVLITPRGVGYNSPTSAYGVVDPGLVLMRIPAPTHKANVELGY